MELSTAGYSVAGDDFDKRLIKDTKDDMVSKLGASIEEVSFLPRDDDRLRTECERCKIELSEKEKTLIQVARACQFGGEYVSLKRDISRTELNNLIDRDVQSAIHRLEEALEQADLTYDDIDKALLIGGTSKIPYVKEILRKKLGSHIIEIENADTIIAEGAAIADGLNLQPTFARSICVELSDGTLYDIFKVGDIAHPESCKKDITFYCTDNREGTAKLIIKERAGRAGLSKPLQNEILSIPISSM